MLDSVPEELITSEVTTPSRAVFVGFPQLCSCQLQTPNKNVNENLMISEEGEILIIKPEHFRLLYNADDFPGGSDGKASAYYTGELVSIPGSGRSSGEGNGNPLQYSWLENPMDRGAW